MSVEAARNWVQKAEHDLKIGRDEMQMPDPVTDMVCFHMQQCVEKYLKAFLVFHDREYPRTHRISALLVLCAELDAAFTELEHWDVDELTDYATTLRYGEDFSMPDKEETLQAVRLAERVRAFVRARLGRAGLAL